jgi:DNA-binding LacI/PurR family transcriptional regulator
VIVTICVPGQICWGGSARFPGISGTLAEDLKVNLQQKKKEGSRKDGDKATLKTIASYLKITPGTVSAALNNSAAARSIPEHTKRRIRAAAQELNYLPNFIARTLRLRRSFTIGVIAEEIGDVYGSQVIRGIEKFLRHQNYLFLTVIHRHDQRLLRTYSQMLEERGVEGLITVDASILAEPSLPTVAVAGHRQIAGVTNIVLNHKRAARLALEYLRDLGHEEIAFLQGHVFSSTRKIDGMRSPRQRRS